MNALLAALAPLPFWAIAAIVGGIFGAAGGLLGGLLAKAGWANAVKFVPVAAMAISFPVTKSVVMPAIIHAQLNAGLPKKLDDVTIAESAEITKGGIAYRYQLIGDIPADFTVEAIKQASLAGLCQNWSPDFKAGRATQIDYIYRWDGGDDRFSVYASDCP